MSKQSLAWKLKNKKHGESEAKRQAIRQAKRNKAKRQALSWY